MPDAAADLFALFWKSSVMGVVEGLTEFVPVSSTGHLIVTGHLLDFGSAELEIFIQVGAMLALTWAYRGRLVALAADARGRPAARAFVGKVLLAFVPAAAVGLLAHRWIERVLFTPGFVAAMLAVGGVALIAIDRPERSEGLADLERMSWGQALAIGFGQALALLPGMSRSASTILAGLLVGLDRRAATDFSFLLALPTLYAASLYALWNARASLAGEAGAAMAIGLVAAYASAVVVIGAFLRYVKTNTLRPFGWYRLFVALVIALWLA